MKLLILFGITYQSKSMSFLIEKFEIENAIKYALLPEKKNGVIRNVPLYFAGKILS